MTKRLILMRHAKSSWAVVGQPDHARPLNARGVQAATALGTWLRLHRYEADQALVSTAVRTRDTFAALNTAIVPQFDDTLYNAGPLAIMATLQRARGECVLVIAHNPGIYEFCARLVPSPPEDPRFGDYPTGATLIADVPIADWAELSFGHAITVDFIVPRDLID